MTCKSVYGFVQLYKRVVSVCESNFYSGALLLNLLMLLLEIVVGVNIISDRSYYSDNQNNQNKKEIFHFNNSLIFIHDPKSTQQVYS